MSSESGSQVTTPRAAEEIGVSKGTTTTEVDNTLSKTDKVTNIHIELDGVKYSPKVIQDATYILSNDAEWLDDSCIDMQMKCLENENTLTRVYGILASGCWLGKTIQEKHLKKKNNEPKEIIFARP